MNVRLQYNTNLTAGVFFENSLRMNNYTIKVSMITNTTDPECHNIAYERLKYFVYKILESSVFIDQRELEACKLYTAAGIRLTTLPEIPIDQIIGIMLYCKFNAIMEDHIQVVEVEVSSELGDRMIYFHCEEESLGPFAEDGWWNDSSTVNCDTGIVFGDDALKYLAVQWKDLDLGWPVEDTINGSSDDNKLVFADFKKDETK